METVIILVSGLLVTVATYFILSKSLIKVILGTAILTHAVHLLIMAMGGFKGESVPIVNDGESASYVDALPQALILTSIVISFAVTAFFLVLAYQTYKQTKTDQLDQLRGYRHD